MINISKKFIIIDDDANIRKMLELIINKNELGKVVCQLESGEHAADEIAFYSPDIVLIDMLLPVADGISIVSHATELGFTGKFIMISQVQNPTIVSKSYEAGVVFYISKPLNSIEVINVIKNVGKIIDLENSLSAVKSAVFGLQTGAAQPINSEQKPVNIDEMLNHIFTDIGIVGMAGSGELKMVILKIIDFKKHSSGQSYQLQTIYQEVLASTKGENYTEADKKTFEQRIRRVLQRSLTTIAELGCDDYYNSVFTEYSTLLFDFKQVRQEMRFISDHSEDAGKINTKKFIEGILSKLKV